MLEKLDPESATLEDIISTLNNFVDELNTLKKIVNLLNPEIFDKVDGAILQYFKKHSSYVGSFSDLAADVSKETGETITLSELHLRLRRLEMKKHIRIQQGADFKPELYVYVLE